MTALLLIVAVASGATAATHPPPKLDLTATHVVPTSWGATYRATIESSSLGTERKVAIFLPATFDKTTRRYPVLFLSDGEYNFEEAVVAARELAQAGNIPEC